ncbi:MAG TPA: MBL fold metallo-hydrolase [Gemmatimonadaceae bacterium]|nr:MBL fold metallo-hydrolase [Gemmatimonadaceae bacterium]
MSARNMRMVLASAALLIPLGARAQNFDSVQVRAQQLRGGVYMLTGSGGNIGLSVGADGAFIVDDQYAPLSAKIIAAVKTVTPQPIKFVVNTHWHGDHTGGNENIGKAGALIVAHENVRKRMSVEQFNAVFNRRTAASPAGALPVVTFTDSMTFHINGDDLVAYHVPPAHTDGDAVIHFTKADVVHMGDTFFNGGYPFVDVSSGGNVNGVIGIADRVLAACTPTTIIIPGHGPVADCAALKRYRDVVASVRDRVQAQMAQGRTLEQIRAAKPSAEFDATWGRGFIRPDVFVELVWRSLGGK